MKKLPQSAKYIAAGLLAVSPAPAQSLPTQSALPRHTAQNTQVPRGANTPPPHFGRAALEMLAFLGVGATWYWIDLERNLADWDRLSLQRRFSPDAIRLDNNEFAVNHVWHPVAGSFYYAFSRANGLSTAWSSVFTLGTSIAWEYGLEFQERTSYNDFLVTPGAGIAVGEAVHALANYVNRPCRHEAHPVAAWTVGLSVALHQELDGRTPCAETAPHSTARQSLQAQFSLGTAFLRSAAQEATARQVHFDSELIELPNYNKNVDSHGLFYEAQWTRLRLDLSFGVKATGTEFEAHSILVGYHHQRAYPRQFTALTTGIGLGYRYDVGSWPGFRDQHSQMNLPGLYQRVLLQWGATDWLLSARLSPDFTATNSLVLGAARAALQGRRGKSVLAKQAYYYGYGWSSHLTLRVRNPIGLLEVASSYSEVHSLDGYDRVQEQLQVDEQGYDRRSRWAARLRANLPGLLSIRPYIEASWQRLRRNSVLEQFRQTRQADRIGVYLGGEL